jgi:hypothetical protein
MTVKMTALDPIASANVATTSVVEAALRVSERTA